uniref:Uncharacterized protein n=1 Tax=Podoviridae sp. ctsUe5 TaxID=2827750 RepID=A0A8S5S5N7_9CAUD|nr:MAG TPA: hypothetical protein [Podoviridae sp. ctsUe5]
MKFDILKFIDDACQDYLQGWRTKESVLNDIKSALDENSWQNQCDGKEAIDDVTGNGIGKVIETNNNVWAIHSYWCIKDNTEDNE